MSSATASGAGVGLSFRERHFCPVGVDPFDTVSWEFRQARIVSSSGEVKFQQDNVEVPTTWSQDALDTVAEKYFYGKQGTPERETSVRQVISRIAGTIAKYGLDDGYFNQQEYEAYRDDLTWLLLHQYMAPNSPVWFNMGLHAQYGIQSQSGQKSYHYDPTEDEGRGWVMPVDGIEFSQSSACFVLKIPDNIDGIFDSYKAAARLFKYGSGYGADWSTVRSTYENLSGGGRPSGPLSFASVLDCTGGVMESGGRCLDGDTMVLTDEGPVPVERLAELGVTFNVFSHEISPEDGDPIYRVKRAKAWRNGRKPTVKVVTDQGYLVTSRDHPFRLASGVAVIAEQLKTGDLLCAGATCESGQFRYATPVSDQEVVSVTAYSDRAIVYSVEVDCPTPDDKSPESGHNYLVWPHGGGADVKSGVCVFNTRRAAIMMTIKDHHPNVREFSLVKARQEALARVLIDLGGLDSYYEGEAYKTVRFQNANMSVRLSDAFFDAVLDGEEWQTKLVTDPSKPGPSFSASEFFNDLCDAAWYCGDPGIQCEDTIQAWHTCPNTEPINSSNPCILTGTRLLTKQGWRKVEDLVDQEVELFDGLSFVKGKVWKTGKKPVIRVHTNRGMSLDLTADHRIYSSGGGWVEASNASGVTIPWCPVPGTSGDSQLPKCITGGSGDFYSTRSPELMEVLGFLQGDGTLSANKVSVSFTPDKDGEFVHDTLLPLLSDIAANTGESYSPSLLSEGRSGYELCRIKLANWLKELGFSMETLPYRRLPEMVWSSRQQAQASFLRGLFSANGNVLRDARDAVLLVSACREMLQEVQLLLQAMGIVSSVRVHNKEQDITWPNGKVYTSKESYHLEITHQEDLYNFSRKVGFVQATQQDRLQSILSTTTLSAKAVASRHRAVQTITSVEDLGVEDDVYDFSCPTTQAGLANGIVVHNCSEYMFIDDTSCNLLSLRLGKFFNFDRPRGQEPAFKLNDYLHALRIGITAQEIVVDRSGYPTQKIAQNSWKFRPLGIGYADLGAVLMALGHPYDSIEARDWCSGLTSLLTGQSYRVSSFWASRKGAFAGYAENRDPMLQVMRKHQRADDEIVQYSSFLPSDIRKAAQMIWEDVILLGSEYGFRNSQVSVLAPTGTISFVMDCDTTGIEPFFALKSYKKLVGGGFRVLVCDMVKDALFTLGYSDESIEYICKYVETHSTVEGCSEIMDSDIPVFDCALASKGGTRSIHWNGHIDMMIAAQPFITGAQSKTINMPNSVTRENVKEAYLRSWRGGLKSMALYRDGSKRSQPMNTSRGGELTKFSIPDGTPMHEGLKALLASPPAAAPPEVRSTVPYRRKLSKTRPGLNHAFSVGGFEGYIHTGVYEDGTLGEVFIDGSKCGSTMQGLMGGIGLLASMGLQYGVPLATLVDKLSFTSFEPAGFTGNPDIPQARSILDYVFRWLGQHYLGNVAIDATIALTPTTPVIPVKVDPLPTSKSAYDSPPCERCGSMTRRTGACWTCINCHSTSGCG